MNLRRRKKTRRENKGYFVHYTVENGGCLCIDPCMFRTDTLIGSVKCNLCMHQISNDRTRNIVICKKYNEFKKKDQNI